MPVQAVVEQFIESENLTVAHVVDGIRMFTQYLCQLIERSLWHGQWNPGSGEALELDPHLVDLCQFIQTKFCDRCALVGNVHHQPKLS